MPFPQLLCLHGHGVHALLICYLVAKIYLSHFKFDIELLFSFATVILKNCLLKMKMVILGTKKMLHFDMKLLMKKIM